MLAENLLKKALSHFPRWMDIRKRWMTSNGGRLLSSVSEEVASVEQELKQFVDEFFISYYYDKFDSIPDIVCKGIVGELEIAKIKIISPKSEITNDYKVFSNNNNYVYYDNDVFVYRGKDLKRIEYEYSGIKMEVPMEVTQLWNIYDEFAAFVGIRRYELETNEELYNRILNTSKRVINSSQDGLKNAVIASLTGLVDDLDMVDIDMERPTAKSLEKHYNDFESILDKLMNINRDVLKIKSWDVDKWYNEFKELDYLPHMWNIIIDEYVNGIGDNDDLKPILIDTNTYTNINMTFYRKSQELLDYYIKNKNIEDKIQLSLIKYNNTIVPEKLEYKITASDAIELNGEEKTRGPISFIAYESRYKNGPVAIKEFPSTSWGINFIKGGILEEGKYYRILITPKDEWSEMNIKKCGLVYEHGYVATDENGKPYDFRYENEDFEMDHDILKHRYDVLSITSKDKCVSAENILDTREGMIINNIGQSGSISIDIKDRARKIMKIFYDCEMADVPSDKILMKNFYLNNGKYYSDTVNGEKNLSINIMANELTFTIESGRSVVTIYSNGEVIQTGITNPGKITIPKSYKMKNVYVNISPIGNEVVVISNIRYNSFDINLLVGNDILVGNKYDEFTIPESNNNLNIIMTTYTQYTPILKKVFIGSPLVGASFQTDIFQKIDNLYLGILSDCRVDLYENSEPFSVCDPDIDGMKVYSNYSSDDIYVATSNDSYITIDTSLYTKIDSIDFSGLEHEVNGSKYKIKMTRGQTISHVIISGYYDSIERTFNIHLLLRSLVEGYAEPEYHNGIWIYGYKTYISKNVDSFILENIDKSQRKINISFSDIQAMCDKEINKVEIGNMPDNVQSVFVSGNVSTINNIYSGKFDNIYLSPKQGKVYVAINNFSMYADYAENISIVNTFNNGYIDNKLMTYSVSPTNIGFKISFENGSDWCINKKTLKAELENKMDFNFSRRVVTDNTILSTSVPLKNFYLSDSGDIIELAQFMISNNENYEIVYRSDSSDPTYIKEDIIIPNSDKLNKVRYSNIYGVNLYYVISGSEVLIDPNLYTVDEKRGIIVWKEAQYTDNRVVARYIIRKPVSIKYNIDYLYDRVQYPVSAYEKIESFRLYDLNSGDKINMKNPIIGDVDLSEQIKNAYEKSDVVYVECSQPGFKAIKEDDYIIIKKTAEQNTLAVKSGWYYMFGKEYFLFASDQSENLVEDEFLIYQEVKRNNDSFIMHRKSTNYVKNSKMTLGSISPTYNIKDFSKFVFTGSSKANAITACDNYNYWNSFGTNITLDNGINGKGLRFTPIANDDANYAYIDITKYIEDNTFISFYNPEKMKVFIGESVVTEDLLATDIVNISNLAEIQSNENNIYYTNIRLKYDRKVFLVVKGSGLIDDIIIHYGSKMNLDLHTKNISILNYNIGESMSNSTTVRLLMNNTKGNKNNNTEINSEGYIITSSSIDWNVTKIKRISSYSDWTNGCILNNVSINHIGDMNVVVKTANSPGNVTTNPIYIGDPKTINRVIFKVNDIAMDSMTGFKIDMYQMQTVNSAPMRCNLFNSSFSTINHSKDLIYPYIKLSVDMPIKKVIDNIEVYVEYKSTEDYAPSVSAYGSGTFISKVFDAKYSADYRLKEISTDGDTSNVDLYIRAAKSNSKLNVWTDWKKIDGNNMRFNDYEFFQIRADLKSIDSKIKINYFDLEVIE